MGCTSSKVDDLPAVVLCRDRCGFLEEAIQQRYAFADAHVAYIQSLKDVGASLHRFFDQDLDYTASPSSPVLHLPPQRKGDPVLIATDASSSSPPDAGVNHSRSNSGSHIHFHSDSDDEDGDSGSLHHPDNSSPLHSNGHHHDYHDYETRDSVPAGHMNMNFMKSRATPSLVYQQSPMGAESVRMGESTSYDPYPYPNYNPSSYPYDGYPNYGGGINGFFRSPPPYSSSSPPRRPQPSASMPSASSSERAPAPPPPSPPRNSPWDFLNPFETFEKFYPPYAPSRDSKEVREDEGIPDLEDDEYRHEVVKEVHGDQKFVDVGGNYTSMAASDGNMRNDGEELYRTKPKDSVENDGVEYKVHMVDRNVVTNKEQSAERGNVAAFKTRGGLRRVADIMRDVRAQFEKASESGNEVSKMLEAGKLPYSRKSSVYQVSSKMLHVITPLSVVSSQASTAKSAEPSSSSSAEKAGFVYLEDAGMRSISLSSTMQKLYIWEKKLYDEVKAEEKMRIIHERKCSRLKRLDQRGAEVHKVDSTQTLVRTLSTKIRIAIQVVDKISDKINKLRDEELWPQLNELVQGLIKMWKVMLECHRHQCQAIAEAKNLDSFASNRKLDDAHLEVTMQLEVELIKWISSFTSWIGAQKGYIRALNKWLLKCILYEPEETPDGRAPFSPSRIGAPPVFVICNQWSQAMDRVSEKEVIDSMRAFAEIVLQLYERDTVDLRQRMMVNRDMGRTVKSLEREEQKIQKAIQALEKQMILVSGEDSGFPISSNVVHQRGATNIGSLQSGLKIIFEAMERFTASSMKPYEDIWARSEEYMHDPANMNRS